ncbi:MAG: hypothetical protein C4527_04265 [Candidatus Omnitrophota bacterium]|jgi:Fe-S-cluster containining protein|nr:MAG: hypothetical protein C4527_04265 [Candidatus Omnitrophota bacterium]
MADPAQTPVLTLRLEDINSTLCRHCAQCCNVKISVHNVDSRLRQYYRKIGMDVQPPISEGAEDCCGEPHDVTIDFGECIHLKKEGNCYECDIYDERPILCKDFNCVAWALVNNAYNEKNVLLMKVQSIKNNL